MKYSHIIGKTFGLLTVKSLGVDAYMHCMAICVCRCGRKREILAHKLIKDSNADCLFCRSGVRGKRTPEYQSWSAMRTRCYDPHHKAYKRYGGRGITVCDRWRDFRLFFDDMGKRPSLDFSLDRINPNDGYHKDNCQWVRKRFNCAYNKRNTFTETEVQEIKTFLNRGITVGKIAKFYDSSRYRINRIKHGLSYAMSKN
jgi:hypothetical protein